MAESWDNIFAPSLDLARSVVVQNFPKFEKTDFTSLGEGWDCVAFRCGDWVFRFPRRPLGVATLQNERDVLPELGHEILPGEPSGTFPYLFLGSRFQAGSPLEEYDGPRDTLSTALGLWLRKLHETTKPRAIQPDVMGKLCPKKRTAQVRQHLGHQPDWLPKESPKSPERVVVHGDLYCRHIYVDKQGKLLGVIDWGDVHWGHRSADLAVAYTLFGAGQRGFFWKAYGDVCDDTKTWARFRGLYHSLLVRDYANKTGLERLYREAESAVTNCLLPRNGLESGSSTPESNS